MTFGRISFERNNPKINDIFLTAYKFHRKKTLVYIKTDCFDEKLKITVVDALHTENQYVQYVMHLYCVFQFFVKTVCFLMYINVFPVKFVRC